MAGLSFPVAAAAIFLVITRISCHNERILPLGRFGWMTFTSNGQQSTVFNSTTSPFQSLAQLIGRPPIDTALPPGVDAAAVAAEEARIKSFINSCPRQTLLAYLRCPCSPPGARCADPLSRCSLESHCVCDGRLGYADPTGTKCVAFTTTTKSTIAVATTRTSTTRTSTTASTLTSTTASIPTSTTASTPTSTTASTTTSPTASTTTFTTASPTTSTMASSTSTTTASATTGCEGTANPNAPVPCPFPTPPAIPPAVSPPDNDCPVSSSEVIPPCVQVAPACPPEGQAPIDMTQGVPVVLLSPNYPGNPPTDQTCTWRFSAPLCHTIEIVAMEFHVEFDTPTFSCVDSLTIGSSGPYCDGFFCPGNLNGRPLELNFVFVTKNGPRLDSPYHFKYLIKSVPTASCCPYP